MTLPRCVPVSLCAHCGASSVDTRGRKLKYCSPACARARKPLLGRVLKRVRRVGTCLEWTGWCSEDGYALMRVENTMRGVHRVHWEEVNGPIVPGLELDHLCRNRKCVELTHLEPVTKAENIRRGKGPTAVNGRKTHCIRGHALTGDNVLRSLTGRTCRMCARQCSKEYKTRVRRSHDTPLRAS